MKRVSNQPVDPTTFRPGEEFVAISPRSPLFSESLSVYRVLRVIEAKLLRYRAPDSREYTEPIGGLPLLYRVTYTDDPDGL